MLCSALFCLTLKSQSPVLKHGGVRRTLKMRIARLDDTLFAAQPVILIERQVDEREREGERGPCVRVEFICFRTKHYFSPSQSSHSPTYYGMHIHSPLPRRLWRLKNTLLTYMKMQVPLATVHTFRPTRDKSYM